MLVIVNVVDYKIIKETWTDDIDIGGYDFQEDHYHHIDHINFAKMIVIVIVHVRI